MAFGRLELKRVNMFYPHTLKGKVNLRTDLVIEPPELGEALNTAQLDGTVQFDLEGPGILGEPFNWSVNIWAKRDVTGVDQALFHIEQGVLYFHLGFTSDSIVAGFLSDVFHSVGSFGSVTDNNWHMITLTATSGSQRVYLDGVDIGGNTILDVNLPLPPIIFVTSTIGANFNGVSYTDHFEGSLAFPKIFERDLTAGEVATLYNSGVPLCHTDLPSAITDDAILAPRLANWDTNAGEELDNQGTAADLITGAGIPFTGFGLNVSCT